MIWLALMNTTKIFNKLLKEAEQADANFQIATYKHLQNPMSTEEDDKDIQTTRKASKKAWKAVMKELKRIANEL